MPVEFTTEQFTAFLTDYLAKRAQYVDSPVATPFPLPTLECCDGPARQITFRFHAQEWMRNPNGVVHGGIIATLLDNCMGILTYALAGAYTPTINITINYARPILLGSDVLLTTQIATLGRTMAQVTAQIVRADEPDKTVATAMGVYYTAHSFAEKKK